MTESWLFTAAYLLFYSALHSLLASSRAKAGVGRLLGSGMAFYRFGYVALSLLLLAPIPFLPFPAGRLYCIPAPWAWGLHAVQAGAVLGFLWAVRSIDNGEFLGLSQIRRHRTGNHLPSGQDEIPQFVTRGPYRFCRHPLYFFSIAGLAAQPCVPGRYALLAGWAILYLWLGVYIDEYRLVRRLGEAYRRYQAVTPRLLPLPRRSKT